MSGNPHYVAYLVAVDFNAPEHNYVPFVNELQSSLNWWHYLKTVWIVLRLESPHDLAAKLIFLLHANDRLLILPAVGPWNGMLPAEAWSWMNANAPNLVTGPPQLVTPRVPSPREYRAPSS